MSTVCDLMADDTVGSPYQRLVGLQARFVNESWGGECMDSSWDAMLADLKNTSVASESLAARSWWVVAGCAPDIVLGNLVIAYVRGCVFVVQ